MQSLYHGLLLLTAACLEVGGDAVVRKGLRGRSGLIVLAGACLLGIYGLVVNGTELDFSKLLGVYVAVFAVVSVAVGKFYFAETIPLTTWMGLGLIVVGGLVIHFGSR